MYADSHYGRNEARTLLGKTFEAAIELPDVEKGAQGIVVGIVKSLHGWELVIKWQLKYRRGQGERLTDRFTKEDIRKFMREVQPASPEAAS